MQISNINKTVWKLIQKWKMQIDYCICIFQHLQVFGRIWGVGAKETHASPSTQNEAKKTAKKHNEKIELLYLFATEHLGLFRISVIY